MVHRDGTPTHRLIVTADDFGAGGVVDRGILRAVEVGTVTTVSALTNYPGAGDAIRELHRAFPHVGIGVHLNLTSGPPVQAPSLLGGICDPQGMFQGLPRLLGRLDYLDITAVESELSAQIAPFHDAGIPVDHLSSHHNVLGDLPAVSGPHGAPGGPRSSMPRCEPRWR